jgi:hypothetical protein
MGLLNVKTYVPFLQWLTFVVAAAGLVYGLYWIVNEIGKNNLRSEIALPFLVVLGVLVIVLLLGLLSVAFSFRNMTDRGQALGLPEGSVRAVVALLLVVLFAILSISLYTSLAQGNIDQITGLTAAQKDALFAKVPNEIVGIAPSDPQTKPPTYSVWHRAPENRASQDFAKQLLVMIGTLVTAVASFYFGTSSVASAQAAANRSTAANPVVKTITPVSTARGAPTPLTIGGQSLGSVNAVTLSKGATKVSATDVLSNTSTVTCSVTLDEAGDWDVTVTDESGAQAKSPIQLKVQ